MKLFLTGTAIMMLAAVLAVVIPQPSGRNVGLIGVTIAAILQTIAFVQGQQRLDETVQKFESRK